MSRDNDIGAQMENAIGEMHSFLRVIYRFLKLYS